MEYWEGKEERHFNNLFSNYGASHWLHMDQRITHKSTQPTKFSTPTKQNWLKLFLCQNKIKAQRLKIKDYFIVET